MSRAIAKGFFWDIPEKRNEMQEQKNVFYVDE